MRTVYLETTIVSYYVSRPSRDLVIAARQELTREWWETKRDRYRLCISPLVTDEAGRGDPDMAAKRVKLLSIVETLQPASEIEPLAERIKAALGIPDEKEADALHLAFAVHHRVDYLLTWNCAHLANPATERALADFVRADDLWLPIICTPENMIEEEVVP